MIVVIALNPAIDRTVILRSSFEYEAVNVVEETIVEVGGRGINIARAIRSLGGDCNVLGFCAGNNGRALKEKLTSLGIGHDFTEILGETRVNTQIIEDDGTQTKLNELGPKIEDGDYLRFLEKLKLYLSPENLIVLSGGIPHGMKESQYMKIVKTIKRTGAKMLVDTDGDTLRKVLEYKPYFIKPNSTELARVTGNPRTHDPEEALRNLQPLLEQGAQNVCASLGKSGAVFVFGDEKKPLYIVADAQEGNKSAVGSGDAMMGAIAHAHEQHMSNEELAKFAVSMGTATAKLPGTQVATMKDAFEVYEHIKVYTM